MSAPVRDVVDGTDAAATGRAPVRDVVDGTDAAATGRAPVTAGNEMSGDESNAPVRVGKKESTAPAVRGKKESTLRHRPMRRIVVKVGTNTLSQPDGAPDPAYMLGLAAELSALVDGGHNVILVSSGAIGAGRKVLGLREPSQDVRMRQACAAVGQPHLMSLWRSSFEASGRKVAQVLVTAHTFDRRRSYLNLKNTMETLLDLGIIPIVNENDTVSIEEIDASFGDNDRLSALVAAKMEADCLFLLSDVDGLYTRPPGTPGAALVPLVEELSKEVWAMAGTRSGSNLGRGGMRSKLESARIAMDAGVDMRIVQGREDRAVTRVVAGETIGTRFVSTGRTEGRKHWLLHVRARGRVHVDSGAVKALGEGRHLLPAGVVAVEGMFEVESVVEIVHDGRAVAKALCGYSSEDLARIAGQRSEDVHDILGTEGPTNVTRKGALVSLG